MFISLQFRNLRNYNILGTSLYEYLLLRKHLMYTRQKITPSKKEVLPMRKAYISSAKTLCKVCCGREAEE